MKDLVLRSALEIPTPNLDKAVLEPRAALLNAATTVVKSLPVPADTSIAILSKRWASAELRVALAKSA